MSSSDFEAQVRQSVADHLALIQTAAAAAKSRVVTSVEVLRGEPEDVMAMPSLDAVRTPKAAVDFSAQEPAFEDLAVEGIDDEGIPVWEDAP